MSQNVYTFDVAAGANKTELKKAVFAVYKVKPLRINIVNLPVKKVFSRGKTGRRGGGRKALVYLKAGDKIEI